MTGEDAGIPYKFTDLVSRVDADEEAAEAVRGDIFRNVFRIDSLAGLRQARFTDVRAEDLERDVYTGLAQIFQDGDGKRVGLFSRGASRGPDANWGGDKNDRKSTTGYVFIINNGAVSWTSHKQSTVALSTMEAEYMSLSDAAREVFARCQLFRDLNITIPTTVIYSDNQGAIAENPMNYTDERNSSISGTTSSVKRSKRTRFGSNTSPQVNNLLTSSPRHLDPRNIIIRVNYYLFSINLPPDIGSQKSVHYAIFIVAWIYWFCGLDLISKKERWEC